MTRYLVAIFRPEGYDPATAEDAAMGQAIDALNREMVGAGVRVFVGGLRPPADAISIRRDVGKHLQVTDGPFIETKEQIGGFWVLEVASATEALAWGQKAALACKASVEVRPFH